jgi:trk system potassium uptake protein
VSSRPRGASIGCSVCHVHIVIMGCGRVGSLLATLLDEQGHSVSVIDQESSSFRKLSSSFSGTTVKGVGFDRETLEAAGIDRAHAFAAVSSGDNSNILAARVARETYGVPHVVARIYDPQRAAVYQRLGIPTVATVSWTASQIMKAVLPASASVEYTDPTGSMTLAEVPLSDWWLGKPVSELESESGAKVAFITRYGNTELPTRTHVLQEGDAVHMLFHPDNRSSIEDICLRRASEQVI